MVAEVLEQEGRQAESVAFCQAELQVNGSAVGFRLGMGLLTPLRVVPRSL